MSDQLKEAIAEAERQVNRFLPQCCRELLEWSDTSILGQGMIREIAAIMSPHGGIGFTVALKLTISMVERQAMQQVAAEPNPGPSFNLEEKTVTATLTIDPKADDKKVKIVVEERQIFNL